MLNGVLAVILIGLGGVLLLSNINIIELEYSLTWGNIYPLLLVGLGIKIWFSALHKADGSWVIGSLLTIIGSLLILDRLQVLDFIIGDMLKLWPLLFIYIGFHLFSKGTKGRRGEKRRRSKHKSLSKKGSRLSVGSVEYKQPNWKVEPMDLSIAVGELYFDFTRAFIPETDTPIYVRGWIGDITMVIPKSVPFRAEAYVKTGDVTISGENAGGLNREMVYESEDYHTATRRLTLYIDLKVGSIQLDHL
nr:cell wall-active antibiotics response protein LiaF [Halobacillus locisalis]